jgi:hypothetical protein
LRAPRHALPIALHLIAVKYAVLYATVFGSSSKALGSTAVFLPVVLN